MVDLNLNIKPTPFINYRTQFLRKYFFSDGIWDGAVGQFIFFHTDRDSCTVWVSMINCVILQYWMNENSANKQRRFGIYIFQRLSGNRAFHLYVKKYPSQSNKSVFIGSNQIFPGKVDSHWHTMISVLKSAFWLQKLVTWIRSDAWRPQSVDENFLPALNGM